MDDFCKEKGIKREYSVARTPQQNGAAESRNRTLIEAAKTMLADSKLPTTFWAKAVSIACYVQNSVLVVKPHNKTPYELFRGFKPALSFMRPFRCHVTILNTLDRRVEENLHIGFLENKPMIDGNGPKWLFDIDSLTQSMNYVTIAAGTIINEFADASYFDSFSKDVDNGEPKSTADDQKQVEDGLDNENDAKDKSDDDSSPKEVNVANTASPDVNTGSFKLNDVGPSVNTASSYDQDSPKDMFTMGASHTLEATHVEFFSDEDEPEVDLGNITNSYTVPTTPNTRIHKDHPIENVIGDVKSSVQTRRMTKPTSEQGIAKALSDSSWVEAIQEELLVITKKNFDYERSFCSVARIEAIRLFLAYAYFMGFLVYQMDVKSAFLYGTIEEEVYITQPPGFKDPDHPDKVYNGLKHLLVVCISTKTWYETFGQLSVGNGFKRGKINKTLFIKKQKGDILLIHVYVDDIIFGSTNKELCTGFEKPMKENQDKYVAEILKKFNYTDVKSASTPVDLEKPLVKDGDADDVDERKSTTGGSQFLRNRLISWQCKKQTVVATSTTKAEYVAAASCCGQVLWIQNQLLDYGYNFMNTVINIDNNSFDAGRFQYLVSNIRMLNP
ncbi:putative ribonuclease H-like domain-containing protein [Tanacetum coccineum]